MKLLRQIIGIGFALWLPQASAVELSAPQVVSFQGQNLNAFVDLQDSASQLQVQLGSAAEYAQLQVPRYSVVEQLQLAIVDAPLGGQRLSVRSTRPMVEPNVQLVVRISDGVEQHLRSLSLAIPAPLSATIAATLQTSENRRTKLTQPNDTLWSVAKDSRDSVEVTVQQQMLAIVRLNPDAFIAENVNGLKSGYLLQLPELFEASLLTASAALREVKMQYKSWVDEGYGRAESQPVQSDVGRLRIVATQPSQDLGSGIVQPRDQVARSTMGQGSLGKDANVADLGTLIEERGATEPEGLELPTPLDDAPVNAASVRPEQTAAPSSEEQRVAVAESVRQQPGMSLPSSPARIDDTQQVQIAQAGSSRGDAAPAAVGSKAKEQTLSPGLVSIAGTLVLTLIVLLMVWRRRRNAVATESGADSQMDDASDFTEPTVTSFDSEADAEADNIEDSTEAPFDNISAERKAPLLVSTSGLPSMSGSADEDDIIETRIKLAVAFIEVGDEEGARELLQEVLEEGDEEQQTSARLLLEELDHPE